MTDERETVAACFLRAVTARVQLLGDHSLLLDSRLERRAELHAAVGTLATMTGKGHAGLLARAERAAAVVHEEATLAARTFTL